MLFRLDAETAHNFGLWTIASGFVSAPQLDDERLVTHAFGRTLSSPLGLAAGFDKNAVALDYWAAMGFAFVEVGTVTPYAQPGNPKPRMFRLPEDRALINRLGFNNDGARAVASRLENRGRDLTVGLNIGKGMETPIERALDDYLAAYESVAKFGDYVVVNVSSPNTPGLRSLQEIDSLTRIVESLQAVGARRLFVKVSPDEPDAILRDIALLAKEREVGLVAINTTTARADLTSKAAQEVGGLSGKPLASRALEVCRLLREGAGANVEIIGTGGIFTGSDLLQRLRAGANVCQVYTSFVYRGPRTAALILNEYLQALDTEGS